MGFFSSDIGKVGLGVSTGGLSLLAQKMGLFGDGGGAPNFDDIISQRRSEIADFQNRLTMSQNNILNSYQNLQSNTMKRFQGDFESSLAARGISPSGGAFASGVGREATSLQGQYDSMNANMTQHNLDTIGGMQADLFGKTLNLQAYPRMTNYQNKMGMQQALGNLAGTGLGFLMGGPMGGAMGGQMGSMLSGGGSSGESMPGFGGYSGFNAYNGFMRGAGGGGRSLFAQYTDPSNASTVRG